MSAVSTSWFKRNKSLIASGVLIVAVLGFMFAGYSTRNYDRIKNTEKINEISKATQDINLNNVVVTIRYFFVLVFALVFIVMFKEEIKDILLRVKRFKIFGTNGIDTEICPRENKLEKIEKKEEQVSDEIYEEKKKDEHAEEPRQLNTLDDWRREMFMAAIIEKDKERTDKAFEEIKKIRGNEPTFKNDEITYLELSHRLGNTNAITELKNLLKDKEVSFKANIALGYCYEVSDDLENASFFYLQAQKEAKNDNDKVDAAKSLSTVQYENGKGADIAINILAECLTDISEDLAKVKLYEGLADVYEKEKDYTNKAFVIDKAIELKPNDPALLFKAGYAYAEAKYDEMALLHYKNAREINPKDNAVQNNLGVQYDNLNMPIKSIESYKKATEFDNTLANANLAYRFLQIGFIKEAKEVLDLVKNKEEVHPNVNAALSEIPTRIEKENELEKKQNQAALLLRKFFLNFVEAKFVKGELLRNVSENWILPDGTLFKFEVSDNIIRGFWKRKIWTYEECLKLEGKIFNNSSEVDIYEKEYIPSKNDYEYKKKRKGFLYFGETDGLIHFLEIEDTNKIKKVCVLKKEKG